MEREFVRWLRNCAPVFPGTDLGIGDDASVHRWANENERLVVTTDLLVEGTHFLLAEAGPQRVGRKSLAVNLSDLAAMAARPVAAWVSLLTPRQFPAETLREIYAGIFSLAQEFQVTVAGGDTNCGGELLTLSVTVLGAAQPPVWLRSGARVGDRVLVSGPLGGSLLGHHLDFQPRIHTALWVHDHYEVHAAMDLSDGLSLDLDRMAEASGCGAVLELERIPVAAAAAQRAQTSGQSSLQHALSDGEDFELLLAVPPAEAERLLRDAPGGLAWTDVGEFVAESGLWARSCEGEMQALAPRGYQHGS